MVEIALMVVAALIIGYSKTALGGLAVISVAIFATIMPAKESTAAILAVLMVGDLIACWHYRRDADWSLIRRLLPAVLPGLVLGTPSVASSAPTRGSSSSSTRPRSLLRGPRADALE